MLREIRSQLPGEPLIYVADSANAPWGDKPAEYVRRRLADLVRNEDLRRYVL